MLLLGQKRMTMPLEQIEELKFYLIRKFVWACMDSLIWEEETFVSHFLSPYLD